MTLNRDYLDKHTQLGYAATGHSSQGATVDVARVVAGVGNLDKASVYVPMTRGREGNFLYIAETQPGDTETGHGQVGQIIRRESDEYARDLLVSAGMREERVKLFMCGSDFLEVLVEAVGVGHGHLVDGLFPP